MSSHHILIEIQVHFWGSRNGGYFLADTIDASWLRSVAYADIDGDGDFDVATLSQSGRRISWHENVGGQFEHVWSTYNFWISVGYLWHFS